jgi:hypothetical protein
VGDQSAAAIEANSHHRRRDPEWNASAFGHSSAYSFIVAWNRKAASCSGLR